jgi:hypothetical protein
MRAADDFEVIRARMAELERERKAEAGRKDDEERIRRARYVSIEQVRERAYRTSLD